MKQEPKTPANRVFRKIFDPIVRGEIPPGGVLNQAVPAGRFAVGRGPVRDAVKRFEERGPKTRGADLADSPMRGHARRATKSPEVLLSAETAAPAASCKADTP